MHEDDIDLDDLINDGGNSHSLPLESDLANMVESDPNRPVLRKVKKPKRIMPDGANNMSVPPKETVPLEDEESFRDTSKNESFDLDGYLDDQTSLPTRVNDRDVNDSFTGKFIDETDLEEKRINIPFMSGDVFSKKAVMITAAVAFFIGFFFAKIFFTTETVVRDGLQGVVMNPEVPRGRARCGVAEKTQGCVLYIMNPQRQELNARDFYDLASQLTGRQRFVIETGNMRYSATKIRPGDIAQLNIPPL